jgi:hypothetical protein
MLTRKLIKNGLPLLLLIALCFRAPAEVFLVSNTNDTTQPISLRGAIIAANRVGGQNTIILGRSFNSWENSRHWVFRLTIHGANEFAARTGDLNILARQLTIEGVNSNVTIDATGLGDRIFQVTPGATLILKGLTLEGGTAATTPGSLGSGEAGGAIVNAGTLILDHCIITNNSSGSGQPVEGNAGGGVGGDGGAICNFGTLQASDCVISGNNCGSGFDGGYGGNGGGILNEHTCNLTRCIVSGNQAGDGGGPDGNFAAAGGNGGNGGGIDNEGTLVLNECIIGGNSAGSGAGGGDPGGGLIFFAGGWGGSGGSGGGIYNLAKLEVDFSSIFGNTAGNGTGGGNGATGGLAGTGGNGGGIFNSGVLTLNTSTISSNLCGDAGDGGYSSVFVGAPGGTGGSGGGIYNMGLSPGSVELTSCTITLNGCGAGGNGGNGVSGFSPVGAATGGNAGDGGGVDNAAGSDTVIMRNTLIAQNLPNVGGAPATNTVEGIALGQPPTYSKFIGNPGADTAGFDAAGAFTSEGFNLISMSDGSTGLTNGVNGDQAGTEAAPLDPLLGPLQMNGGLTPTDALLWGSPAIDQGKCFGIHHDQRGLSRPRVLGSIPAGGDGSDIGAFELQSRPLE